MKSLIDKSGRQIICFKQIISLFVAVSIILSISISTFTQADEGESGNSEQQTIRVGYCNNSAMLSADSNNEYSGYIYDYLMEIAKYTGWKYEFVNGSVKECFSMLETGTIDLMGSIQYSKERAEMYEFPEYELNYSQGVLYTLSSNRNLCYQDYEAFNGITVGMIEGSQDNIAFLNYAKDHNFKVNEKYYDDSTEAFNALGAEEIQAVVDISTVIGNELKVIDRFNVKKAYLIAQKGRADIISQLNSAIEEALKNDMYFELKLSKKYFGDSTISRQDFTREEIDYIKDNPSLRVVINPNFPPFEKLSIDGIADGVNVDIIKSISEFAGFNIEFVSADTYEQGYEMLKSGKADIISTSPFFEVSNELKLTNEFNSVGMVVLARIGTDIPETAPKIAMKSGLKKMEIASGVISSDAVVVECESLQKCVEAVQKGDADATVVSSLVLDYMYRKRTADNIKVVRMLDGQMPMNVGVYGENTDILLSILNKSITNLNEKQVEQAIVNNTSKIQSEYTLIQLLKDYGEWFILSIAILIILVVAVMSYHRIKLMRQLKQIAYVDEITKQNTIEKFKMQIKTLFSKYGQETYSLLYFDVERFKYFNDTYGMSRGNEVLKYIAECVKDSLYEYEDFARLSADNFVLLIKCIDKKQIIDTFRRIERNAQSMEFLQRNDYTLIFSVGVYTYTDNKTDFNMALDRANTARKSVKGHHETAFGFYDYSMDSKIAQEQELIANMQLALDNNEFVAYYQPKVNLKTGKVCGAEALVRWIDPQRGIIQPDNFVPLFEANGFITKIDFSVFKQACELLHNMIESHQPIVPISVNISRAHMRSNKFIYKLAEIADKYNVPHGMLEIEITESMMSQDTDKINNLLEQLKALGFWVSMDDFGTGYSSLNLLKTIPVDVLKIDRKFFSDTSTTTRERIIIRDIVSMAHHLEMQVVSEGVETSAQEAVLRTIECDVGQGYLYSRPLPKDDFLDYLKKRPVQSVQ